MKKNSFLRKLLNPFGRTRKEEPAKLETQVISGEKKRVINKRMGTTWIPNHTSKFRNSGLPWYKKIGLTKKPDFINQYVIREFGTFSKLHYFRVNGRELKKA